MKNKSIIIVISIILVLVTIGVGFWIINKQYKYQTNSQGITKNQKNTASKEQDNLVWYEVPEIGIKFKVTPDTKDDLKYDFTREYVYFYNKSVTDFLGVKRCFGDSGNCLCTNSVISRKSDLDKHSGDFCDKVFTINESEFICYSMPQATNFNSEEEYRKYEDLIVNKKFGIYLNTVTEIKK